MFAPAYFPGLTVTMTAVSGFRYLAATTLICSSVTTSFGVVNHPRSVSMESERRAECEAGRQIDLHRLHPDAFGDGRGGGGFQFPLPGF